MSKNLRVKRFYRGGSPTQIQPLLLLLSCIYYTVNPGHQFPLRMAAVNVTHVHVPALEQRLKQDIPWTACRVKHQTRKPPLSFSSTIFRSFILVVVVNWQLPAYKNSLTCLCCDWSAQIHTHAHRHMHTKKRTLLKSETFLNFRKPVSVNEALSPQLCVFASTPQGEGGDFTALVYLLHIRATMPVRAVRQCHNTPGPKTTLNSARPPPWGYSLNHFNPLSKVHFPTSWKKEQTFLRNNKAGLAGVITLYLIPHNSAPYRSKRSEPRGTCSENKSTRPQMDVCWQRTTTESSVKGL